MKKVLVVTLVLLTTVAWAETETKNKAETGVGLSGLAGYKASKFWGSSEIPEHGNGLLKGYPSLNLYWVKGHWELVLPLSEIVKIIAQEKMFGAPLEIAYIIELRKWLLKDNIKLIPYIAPGGGFLLAGGEEKKLLNHPFTLHFLAGLN